VSATRKKKPRKHEMQRVVSKRVFCLPSDIHCTQDKQKPAITYQAKEAGFVLIIKYYYFHKVAEKNNSMSLIREVNQRGQAHHVAVSTV
jgi:hypothetical protein